MNDSGCLWHGSIPLMGRLPQLAQLGIFQWSIFDHFCPRQREARTQQPLLSKADKMQLP